VYKIYTVIVNYKSEDVIAKAVASFNEEEVEHKIVILDNGSTQESYAALRKELGDVIEIIRTESNLGYSAGANYAVQYIKEKYDDVGYFFFFNPDALATKNMLGKLYHTLQNHDKAAAVSPLILDMQGNKWFSGTRIEWYSCRIENNPKNSDSNRIREIDTFNGCAVLIDAKAFFEVGMFNEDLFIYYDEPFLSMELLKKGYRSLYDPTAVAHHMVSHSSGQHSIFKTHLMTRNHVAFFKKYGKSKSPLCPYYFPLRMILFFLKRMMFKNIYYVLKGIYDELTGKRGAP